MCDFTAEILERWVPPADVAIKSSHIFEKQSSKKVQLNQKLQFSYFEPRSPAHCRSQSQESHPDSQLLENLEQPTDRIARYYSWELPFGILISNKINLMK